MPLFVVVGGTVDQVPWTRFVLCSKANPVATAGQEIVAVSPESVILKVGSNTDPGAIMLQYPPSRL